MLAGVQWADWTSAGHLAQATEGGQLQILDIRGMRVLHEVQLGKEKPKHSKAPAWAEEW